MGLGRVGGVSQFIWFSRETREQSLSTVYSTLELAVCVMKFFFSSRKKPPPVRTHSIEMMQLCFPWGLHWGWWAVAGDVIGLMGAVAEDVIGLMGGVRVISCWCWKSPKARRDINERLGTASFSLEVAAEHHQSHFCIHATWDIFANHFTSKKGILKSDNFAFTSISLSKRF